MNDFESNFVKLFPENNQNEKQFQSAQIEQQLSLAEWYISKKSKKCARLSLLIVYELLCEYKDEDLKNRYNKAVDLFNAL